MAISFTWTTSEGSNLLLPTRFADTDTFHLMSFSPSPVSIDRMVCMLQNFHRYLVSIRDRQPRVAPHARHVHTGPGADRSSDEGILSSEDLTLQGYIDHVRRRNINATLDEYGWHGQEDQNTHRAGVRLRARFDTVRTGSAGRQHGIMM